MYIYFLLQPSVTFLSLRSKYALRHYVTWQAQSILTSHSYKTIKEITLDKTLRHHLTRQKILCQLLSSKAYQHAHNNPALYPIHFKLTLSFTPRFPKVSFLQIFWPGYCIHFSSLSCILHEISTSSFLISQSNEHVVQQYIIVCKCLMPTIT
jgi:hypothetical protein